MCCAFALTPDVFNRIISWWLTGSCNCRVKNNCPLGNKCLTTNIIYRADVTVSAPAQESKFYIGLTGNSFKQRVASHKTSFSHERYREQTRLSMFIWELKDKGADFSIKWSIVRRVRAYQPGDRTCQLCLAEKAEILKRSSDPGLQDCRVSKQEVGALL